MWQPKTSRATKRRHMVIRDPVPEVQFRDEEADTRIVLHARHARRNDCVALWYTDSEIDVFVLMLAHSKNLTSKRCYMKKGRGANILCNLTQAMLTTASWGALIGVNSITGCHNISAFFAKGKLKAVQLLQPMEGNVRVMASIAEKSYQYPMRTLNSRYGSTRVWTVRKEVA